MRSFIISKKIFNDIWYFTSNQSGFWIVFKDRQNALRNIIVRLLWNRLVKPDCSHQSRMNTSLTTEATYAFSDCTESNRSLGLYIYYLGLIVLSRTGHLLNSRNSSHLFTMTLPNVFVYQSLSLLAFFQPILFLFNICTVYSDSEGTVVLITHPKSISYRY